MKRKKIIIIALTVTIVVLTAMFFFLKPFVVVGESMFPAFTADERLVAETLSKHFLKIKRGETIVFREPHERKEIFVKRVIGLPGETVHIADSSVTIISPAGAEETFGEGTLIGGKRNGDPMEMKLGPEDYFVMGDNRQKSTDSRHFGTVQPPDIIGRPILRGFPAKILFPLLTLGEKTPIEAEGAYAIGSSLRFNDDDSAYLSRTPASAGNRKTWTYSLWLKRGSMGSINYTLAAFSNSRTAIRFNAGNELLFTFESGLYDVSTNALFRDPSAYLHLVVALDTTQATASNRVKFYINGSQVTSFLLATYPAQNYDGDFNNNVIQKIGADGTTTFDGLMSEIYFIDGQALTPSSFGVTDANGYWRPKAYTGTYGTNGFSLPFNDGTNTTTLGYDRSGNGNNYTLTNLATTDQMIDTPTNNYATLNPLANGTSAYVSDGNLRVQPTDGNHRSSLSTIAVSSGKRYFEDTVTNVGTGHAVGIQKADKPVSSIEYIGQTLDSWGYYSVGRFNNNAVNTGSPASYTTGDVIGVALDLDAGTITFYKNNVSQGIAFSSLSGTFVLGASPAGASGVANVNFGQRPFVYTPPTGFKTLNTANLPEPAIVQPNKYFDAAVYTGTGAAQSITANSTIVSFTQNGTFTVPTGVTSVDYLVVGGGGSGGSSVNTSVYGGAGGGGAGGFRTGALSVTPGASLTVTVGAGGASVAAGAGAAIQGLVGSDSVFSTITAAGGGLGAVYGVAGSAGGSGGGGCGKSDGTPCSGGAGNTPSTSPSQGNNGGAGGGTGTSNAPNYGAGGGGGAGAVGVAGSTTAGGNGGAGTASAISGSSVTYAGGGGGGTYNGLGTLGAGGSGGGGAAGHSAGTAGTANTGGGGGGSNNGAASGAGGSGIVIIRYINPAQPINFQPDLVWLKDRTSANAHGLFDSVRTATKYLSSNSTAAETTDTNSLTAFLGNGFSVGTTGLFNTSGNSYISWNWKKSVTSGVDIVTYTGNGANRTIAHALGVAPTYLIVKKRGSGGAGAYGWYQWHTGLTSAAYSLLFDTAAESNTPTLWNSTAPNSSVFSVGTSNGSNENGQDYIAYLFAEVPGFSRIGKYTGNGSVDGPFIWTGFKPAFVMIKKTDTAADWGIFDNKRAPYNVVDGPLHPHVTNAEVKPDATTNLDFLANGIKIRNVHNNWNISGGTYIYAAFAEAPFKYSSAADSAGGAAFFLGMSF